MVGKKVIITGITSFLGSSVARYLTSRGYDVFGVARPESMRLHKIKDIKLVKLEDIKLADIFIHFAWGATLDRENLELQKQNVEMSKKILNFAKSVGAKKFIFAGSQAELSDTAYGKTKKEFGEYGENTKDIDFIHMRIFSIYGKGDRDTSLLSTLVKNIKDGKDMDLSSCEYMWNFLLIDDFVKIIEDLIINGKTGVYDIASDDTRLLKDYVLEAHKVLGGKNKLNFGAIASKNEKFSLPNIYNKGFKFTAFHEGIKTL